MTSRTPAVVLLALFLAYAAIVARVPASGFRLHQTFDPLAPRPHVIEQLIVAKRFSEALPLAIELRRSVPNDPQIMYWVAVSHRGLNAPQDEAIAWEEYIRLSPTPVVACPSLPEAYARTGEQLKAIAAYKRCLEFDPRNPERMFDLATAFERAGRASDALALYGEAAALDPVNPVIAARMSALGRFTR